MKRILCLILALLMVFSLLAGCGSKSDKDDEEKDGTTDIQADKEDGKEDETDNVTSASSAQNSSLKNKIVGTWKVDLATFGELPEGLEIQEYEVSFTSTGEVVEDIKYTYEGETVQNSATGAYSFESGKMTVVMDDSNVPVTYELDFQGNIVVLTSVEGVLTLYK